MFNDDEKIIRFVKRKFNDKTAWTQAEEDSLRNEIFKIRQELIADLEEASRYTDNESFDYLSIDEDGVEHEDEFFDPEIFDDFTIGIDHPEYFDLGEPYLYFTYDYYLFWLTTLIIFLTGHPVIVILYHLFGINMKEQSYVDDAEESDHLKLQAMFDFCVKIYYVLEKVKLTNKNIRKYLNPAPYTEDDFCLLLTKKFLNIKNINHSSEDHYLYPMAAPFIANYNTYIDNYNFIMLYCSVKYQNQHQFNYNFYLFHKMYYAPKLNLQFTDDNITMSTTYNMNTYDYDLLYKDINLTYTNLLPDKRFYRNKIK